ncbi:MAG: DnaD domain protein [Clostridia bacterium]|nr:DnaD domain protein [Clostridia bacterium]
MKYKLHYGDGVINLPEAVLSKSKTIDGNTLKVLMCIAAGGNPSKEKIAREIGCDVAQVSQAILFWCEEDILSIDKSSDRKKATEPSEDNTPVEPAVKTVDSAAAVTPAPASLPRYTTEELVALLESRRELAALIDECTRVFGKVFSTHETSILLGIVDYLNVDGEYLLLLLAHCAKMGKKSVRYVEKCAFSFYDDGITTPSALQECLKKKEEMEEVEGKLRTLFGMNSRALTTKERKLIDTWLFTYRYGMDIITRAYEITVDAIGKSSIPYTNSILERWAAANLHTLAEIDAAEESRAATGQVKTAPGNSFDTNDFFDAALKRSFGDDYDPGKK